MFSINLHDSACENNNFTVEWMLEQTSLSWRSFKAAFIFSPTFQNTFGRGLWLFFPSLSLSVHRQSASPSPTFQRAFDGTMSSCESSSPLIREGRRIYIFFHSLMDGLGFRPTTPPMSGVNETDSSLLFHVSAPASVSFTGWGEFIWNLRWIPPQGSSQSWRCCCSRTMLSWNLCCLSNQPH